MGSTSAQEILKRALERMDIPVKEALQFMKDLVDSYHENQREIEKLRAQRDCIIAEIQARHNTWCIYFSHIFAERRLVIERTFKVIDSGLEKGNNELVALGMRELATIVSASPIESALTLAKALESGGVIEI